jgi:hypothetical protein
LLQSRLQESQLPTFVSAVDKLCTEKKFVVLPAIKDMKSKLKEKTPLEVMSAL